MHVGALRGKVSTGQVGNATGAGAARAAPLISLSVQGAKPAKVEKAARELSQIVIDRTTAPYVGVKIKNLKESLNSVQDQLNALAPKITALENVVAGSSLTGLDRVLVATQLDNAQQRRGQLLEQQTTEQQQLALAQNVEAARLLVPASAVKTTARSVRNSILVGGLIGLILGALAAILWEPVAARLASRSHV
jgi:gas vesicle protein